MDEIIIAEKNNLILKIFYSELNDGYMYDWYENTLDEVLDGLAENSIDGGLCTGSMADAIAMAHQLETEKITSE